MTEASLCRSARREQPRSTLPHHMDAKPSSSKSEINGLRALVTTVSDGLHALIMGPLRKDYPTDDEYQAAYDEWYAKVHFWHATVNDVPMNSLRLLTGLGCKSLRNGCNCPLCAADLTRIADQRAHCEACHGDPQRCQQGQGEYGDFAALTGCLAYDSVGEIAQPAPKRARRIRQPWDVAA